MFSYAALTKEKEKKKKNVFSYAALTRKRDLLYAQKETYSDVHKRPTMITRKRDLRLQVKRPIEARKETSSDE